MRASSLGNSHIRKLSVRTKHWPHRFRPGVSLFRRSWVPVVAGPSVASSLDVAWSSITYRGMVRRVSSPSTVNKGGRLLFASTLGVFLSFPLADPGVDSGVAVAAALVRPQCRYGPTRSPLVASGGCRGKRRPAEGARPVLRGEDREVHGVVLVPEPARAIQQGIFVAGVLVEAGHRSHDFQVYNGGRGGDEQLSGRGKLGCSPLGKSDPAGSCVNAWLQNEWWASLVC